MAVAEYFRFGTEPSRGELKVIDGGFVMGSDLEVYDPDEDEQDESTVVSNGTAEVTLPDARTAPPGQDQEETGERSSYEALSSGGLY